jgi:hypothetical protein
MHRKGFVVMFNLNARELLNDEENNEFTQFEANY